MLIKTILYESNKKILFVATDAGSALFLSPIINKMSISNEIYVLSGENSFKTFEYRGIKPEIIYKKTNYSTYLKKIQINKYDFIFLGTNLGYSLEKEITKQSKNNKSFTIAIIDHYWHTWHRFSDLQKPLKITNDYLPDLIWVFNKFQFDQLKSQGIKEKKINLLEHPHLLMLKSHKNSKENFHLPKILDLPKNKKIIVYASEPQPTGKVNFPGEELLVKTIKINAKMLIDSFNETRLKTKDLYLIIKKHPTENTEFLGSIFDEEIPNIRIVYNIDPLKLILNSDLVLGMTSMFLLEAKALGKKVACLYGASSFYEKAMFNGKIKVIKNKTNLKKLMLSL